MSVNALDKLNVIRNELREKLNHLNLDNRSDGSILSQIDTWEQNLLQQVQQTAQQLRQQVLILLKAKQDAMRNQLEKLSNEFDKLKQTNNIGGEDLTRLDGEITRIGEDLKLFSQLPTVKLITNEDQPIDWHRLIYIEQKPAHINSQQTQQSKSLESQQYAAPGTFPEQYCEGRLCIKCGKCRDWYFTGDAETWAWIRNQKNWTEEDVNRWRNGHVIEQFECRPGETCIFDHGFGLPGLPPGPHRDHRLLGFHICLCEDNIITKP